MSQEQPWCQRTADVIGEGFGNTIGQIPEPWRTAAYPIPFLPMHLQSIGRQIGGQIPWGSMQGAFGGMMPSAYPGLNQFEARNMFPPQSSDARLNLNRLQSRIGFEPPGFIQEGFGGAPPHAYPTYAPPQNRRGRFQDFINPLSQSFMRGSVSNPMGYDPQPQHMPTFQSAIPRFLRQEMRPMPVSSTAVDDARQNVTVPTNPLMRMGTVNDPMNIVPSNTETKRPTRRPRSRAEDARRAAIGK